MHGNEESGADAALQVLYELADRTDCVADTVLGGAIVVIMPTQNPDGRFLNTRRNAYGFDMNRDWFARTQPETDGKLELLRRFPRCSSSMLTSSATPTSSSRRMPTLSTPRPLTRSTTGSSTTTARRSSPSSSARSSTTTTVPPYDFFATIFGDTVPGVGFHGAGMTFEKDNRDRIVDRTFQQYLAMWASVFQGATGGTDYVQEWHESYVEAYRQGVAGELEPNGVFNPKNELFQEVPDQRVRHYFLLDRPNRAVRDPDACSSTARAWTSRCTG